MIAASLAAAFIVLGFAMILSRLGLVALASEVRHLSQRSLNVLRDALLDDDAKEAAMQVSKWGDSLAVRLPKALVEKMGLVAGDEINIVDVAERTLVVQKEDRRKAALERIASLNWTLPADYKFDRDEANER